MARIYKENKLRNFVMEYTPKTGTIIFSAIMLLLWLNSTNFVSNVVLALLVTGLYLKK